MAAKNRSWKVIGFYTRFKCYPGVKKCSQSDNKNRKSCFSVIFYISTYAKFRSGNIQPVLLIIISNQSFTHVYVQHICKRRNLISHFFGDQSIRAAKSPRSI